MPRKCDGLLRGHGLLQRARIGQPDIFDGHAHQAPRHIHAILAAFQHSRQPIQRRIGVGRTHALVQRGNQVEMLFARFVVEQPSCGPSRLPRLTRVAWSFATDAASSRMLYAARASPFEWIAI